MSTGWRDALTWTIQMRDDMGVIMDQVDFWRTTECATAMEWIGSTLAPGRIAPRYPAIFDNRHQQLEPPSNGSGEISCIPWILIIPHIPRWKVDSVRFDGRSLSNGALGCGQKGGRILHNRSVGDIDRPR